MDPSFFIQKQNEEQNASVTREDVDYVKEVFEDGKRQMKNGKYELAVASFSKAIKKFRKNPVFFMKRAKCYIKLKMGKEAETDCTKALSLDPKLLKAKFLRSQARELVGNYRGACLDLQDIIILDPNNQTAKTALTRLKPLYQDALREEGHDIFNDEEKENGEESNAILGTLTGSDRAIGETELDETVKRANEEKEKGNSFVKEGNWEEAKKAYSQAILLNPDDAIYYANRALCFLKTNNEHRAVLDCTMALKKNPRYVKAYMRRAAARKGIGDLWAARADVKQTLFLEPNNSQAKQLLEELNVLIESRSEEDVDETSELQQECEEMEVDGPSKRDESHSRAEGNGHADFKYIFPINKPPHTRSKKPLRRVRIKFVDAGNGAEGSQVEMDVENDRNVPDLVGDVSPRKEVSSHDSLKRASSGPTNIPEEKKMMQSGVGGGHVENNSASSSTNLDFKYIFPVNKKPHQRSKKPLVRIPITFKK